MNEAVFYLLFRCCQPLAEKQISLLLGLNQRDQQNQLHELLTFDPRFIESGDRKWKSVDLSEMIDDKPIEQTSFIITDIETTGSIKGKDRIIDIAAVKYRNGEILETFETLVNPLKKISRTINRLTNITNENVSNAPVAEDILPVFWEFAGEDVFVAHNSMFDFAFINHELHRIKNQRLNIKFEICTYRLAKKLLPEVRARGVSGLAKHFKYRMEDRHRAMPDVRATCYFLEVFLKMLKTFNITNLHQLIKFQTEWINETQLQKKLKQKQRNQLKTRFN